MARKQFIIIQYVPLRIGSNSKKLNFHVWKRLSAPKIISITHVTSFQANWHTNLLLKRHLQQAPWWTDFAEIQPKFAQQIETKTHDIWSSRVNLKFSSCQLIHTAKCFLYFCNFYLFIVSEVAVKFCEVNFDDWVQVRSIWDPSFCNICKCRADILETLGSSQSSSLGLDIVWCY